MKDINSLITNDFSLLRLKKTKKYNEMHLKDSTLFIVLAGRLKISYEEKIGYSVPAQSLILLPAGTDCVLHLQEEVTLLLCPFNLENYFMEDYISDLLESSSEKKHFTLEIRSRLKEFLALLPAYIEDEIRSEELFSLFKQQMFLLLRLYYSKEELMGFFHPILNNDLSFKNFVLKNSLKVKTMNELASLANYSTSGFEKKFRKCFNESPYQWILRHKAKRILQDLQLSKKTFKDMAEEYSFSSPSYFYTFCKNHYGQSPREIRKQGKTDLKNSLR